MKKLIVTLLIFTALSSYAQDNSISSYRGRNHISIYNEYFDSTVVPTPDTFWTKIKTEGFSYTFTDSYDLSDFLVTVPDSFKMAVVEFESQMYLPDGFFRFKKLERIQIIASSIPSIDSRFEQLFNLKSLEITCDTLLDLSGRLSRHNNLEYIDMSIRYYYPEKKLKRKVKSIIRRSKREHIAFALSWDSCWKDGKDFKCDW